MMTSKGFTIVFMVAVCSVYSIPTLPIEGTGPKVINGSIAEHGKTKFQVSIRLKQMDWFFGAGHICGGSLIKPSIVLTAAHCVFNYQLSVMRDASEFRVAIGSVDRYDPENNTIFNIAEIFYLDTFNSSTYVSDIAVMILNGSVPEDNPNIQTIAINWNDVAEGSVCQVTGWGITDDGFTSDVLMSLDVPIVNQTVCRLNYEGFVKEGMFCAGYMDGLKDTCNGDSGGPLVCDGKLTGIVSFGAGCALPNYPGVYTEIKYHSEWIRSLTGGSMAQQISLWILLLFATIHLI